ncbi:hypothetical protein [Streptomyces parvulus]|uniref:hypothetical protein n=1 Tax=Streptomyces parvulus TaxID=146923 RepID=UPI00340395D7
MWLPQDALIIGTVGGIGGGLSYALCFTAWGQWLIFVRLLLPLQGRLPWKTDAFLKDAYRRGVLRRTGAVYQFRHIHLQHHFAHAGHASVGEGGGDGRSHWANRPCLATPKGDIFVSLSD